MPSSHESSGAADRDAVSSRPAKSVNAGCLLFDEHQRLLIVHHSYVDVWGIPGGGIEDGESPSEGCRREVREELGLDVHKLTLAAIDYRHGNPSRAEYVRFLFFGPQVASSVDFVLQEDELTEVRFVPVDEAAALVTRTLSVMLARVASTTTLPVYLEDGTPI